MPSIADQKENRRRRLAKLLDEIGPGPHVGYAQAYLFQMSKGKGSQKRNVSDEAARKLEAAGNKPFGWLDRVDESEGPRGKDLSDRKHEVVRKIGKTQSRLVNAAQHLAGTLTDAQAKILHDLLLMMSASNMELEKATEKVSRKEASHA